MAPRPEPWASPRSGATAAGAGPPSVPGTARRRRDDPLREDGQEPRTEAAPARALDHHVLRTVFLDLLGRPPLSGERERWVGRGLYELLDELVGGLPFWRHWLEEQLYYFLLIDNFRPHSEGVLELPALLADGRAGVLDALHRIALSPSFDLRNPGADTFVTVVMEQLCELKVQANTRELEIGKALYDGGDGLFLGRTGGSQSDVVRIAVEDERTARAFVRREHERILKAPAEARETNAIARDLRKRRTDFARVVVDWLKGAAYTSRLATSVPMPNRLFVKTLFVDLLDRLPEPEEAEPVREALDGLGDSLPLRSVLARMMLDSGRVPLPEKAALGQRDEYVRALFLRLLGREPERAEREAFVAALAEPSCRVATVLFAIVSHPEYHRY